MKQRLEASGSQASLNIVHADIIAAHVMKAKGNLLVAAGIPKSAGRIRQMRP